MTDDDLDRCRGEMYRRVDVWTAALLDLEAAETSGDPDAIAEAEEALVSRMASAIEHLEDQGDDDETMQRRALMMHRSS